MYKITIYFFFILSFQKLLSTDFEITPLNINLNGVVIKGDTLITFGDYSSLIVSYDCGKNWKQYRVSETGKIVNCFIEENEIHVINSNGKIYVSNNGGINWKIKRDLSDTINEVHFYKNLYLVRTNNKMISTNKDFDIINSTEIPRSDFTYIKLGNSFTIFKNKIILSIDSSVFLRYDLELKIIDSLSPLNSHFCLSCYSYMNIYSDSNYFYFNVEKSIFRSKDFMNVERIYNYTNYFNTYKVVDNRVIISELMQGLKYYSFKLFELKNENKISKISEFSDTISAQYLSNGINDFKFKNDSICLVGNSKVIILNKLSDTISHTISDFNFPNLKEIPDMINDSTYLFYNSPNIFITTDNGVTFHPNLNPKFTSVNINLNYFSKLYDEKTNLLILGCVRSFQIESKEDGFYKTYDFGKKYEKESFKNFQFNNYFPNITLNKINNYFVTGYNISNGKNIYFNIVLLDTNLKYSSGYFDSLAILHYVKAFDSNSFIVDIYNTIDSTYEIKYTTNKGVNWKTIHKYSDFENKIFIKEVKYKEKKTLAIAMTNTIDSSISIDLLDYEKVELNQIFKTKYFNKIHLENLSIDADSNYIFISFSDSLFYSNDLNILSWRYCILPKSGLIMNNFKIFGNKFLVRYSDNSNPDNLYWMKINNFDNNKPEINALDYDFGKVDINDSIPQNKIIKIENKSSLTKLIIKGYSKLNQNVFFTDLPILDSQDTIIIQPNTSYQFHIQFKPSAVSKYLDSLVFYSDAVISDNITYLRGEGIDTIKNSLIDYETKLYSYPPFPTPSINEVKSLIYNGMSFNIIDSDIGVYDIYGNKVASKDKIILNKLNSYSSYLSWDCSDVSTGIYMIQIKHGTNTHIIRAMIMR